MTAGDRIRIYRSGEVFVPGRPQAPLLALAGRLGTIIDMHPAGVTGGALVDFYGTEYLVPYAMLEMAPA